MPSRRVVVDGSNIATEGRTLPSLKQLNEAVLAFLIEYPDSDVTVVVDASFGHRIDASEVAEFEAAEAANEVVSPPAGAIGRGDAFLLRIAGKIGATVLSNDSFQEFHGEHEWLFTEDRLVGGKPVPGVGWIFTPRTPVRGMKSRKAVNEGKGRVRALSEGLGPMPTPDKPPPRGKAKSPTAAKDGAKAAKTTAKAGAAKAGAKTAAKAGAKTAAKAGAAKAGGQAGTGAAAKEIRPAKADKVDRAVLRAIALAAEESEEPTKGGRKRRRKKRGGGKPAEPVNEPLPFITFIANHKLGAEVEGEVETFTSHGAFVLAGGARCYIPIVALGDPPPRAARDVLDRGEVRKFVVQALDPQRRGIELALPAFARVSGAPTEETIEAEITAGVALPPASTMAKTPAGAKRAVNGPRPSVAKKSPDQKKPAATKAAAKKAAPSKKSAPAAKKAAPAKKAAKKAAPAKKAAKKPPSAKRVVAPRKAIKAKPPTKR